VDSTSQAEDNSRVADLLPVTGADAMQRFTIDYLTRDVTQRSPRPANMAQVGVFEDLKKKTNSVMSSYSDKFAL